MEQFINAIRRKNNDSLRNVTLKGKHIIVENVEKGEVQEIIDLFVTTNFNREVVLTVVSPKIHVRVENISK